MFGYPIAFSTPVPLDKLANERIDKQADAASEDGRQRLAAERFVNCSVILTFETTRRSLFPSFTRGIHETPVAFADRVRLELLKLQGVPVPEVKP